MNRIEIRNNSIAQPHYVYDLAIPLPERMHKRMLFPSAVAAAGFLGVAPQRIYLSRSTKHRIWSDVHHGWFAVRIASAKTVTI